MRIVWKTCTRISMFRFQSLWLWTSKFWNWVVIFHNSLCRCTFFSKRLYFSHSQENHPPPPFPNYELLWRWFFSNTASVWFFHHLSTKHSVSEEFSVIQPSFFYNFYFKANDLKNFRVRELEESRFVSNFI